MDNKNDNINEKLDRVRRQIQDPDFLSGKGLSNEVNIHICYYNPEDEMIVRHFVEQISSDQSIGCSLKIYNLFEVFLSICDDKKITSRIAQMEEKKGKEYLLTQMHSIATVDMFIKKMYYEPQSTGDVLILTGVGEVFPFMRVHTLLNALQPVFNNIPIIVMYPGKFDGSNLQLFNEFKPNQYYRAFNVI